METKLKSNGYTFQIEINQIIEKNFFTIKEVPIDFKERVLGKSKMNYRIIIEAVYFLLRQYFKK